MATFLFRQIITALFSIIVFDGGCTSSSKESFVRSPVIVIETLTISYTRARIQNELGSLNVGEYLTSALEEIAEMKEGINRSGQPSPMATLREMYSRLRDPDVHLFELGDHTCEWVDGWRVDVWFNNGHVEINKDRNDRGPIWAHYLWPPFPLVWSSGGRVPKYENSKSIGKIIE